MQVKDEYERNWLIGTGLSALDFLQFSQFLALLAKGQKSLWDGTLSVVRRPSVRRPSVRRPSVVRKQFTFSSSPLKLLGQI